MYAYSWRIRMSKKRSEEKNQFFVYNYVKTCHKDKYYLKIQFKNFLWGI